MRGHKLDSTEKKVNKACKITVLTPETLILLNMFNLKIFINKIPTSDTVLWNGPSNTYDVHPSQHCFGSHVTFGVTQWKLGVPKPNTSKKNWLIRGKASKYEEKYKTFWYFPKGDTCLKISSNSVVAFSFLDDILLAITPEMTKKIETKKLENIAIEIFATTAT